MGLVLAGIWDHKTVGLVQRAKSDMPGKNEQVSLDMFLEVENMANLWVCLLVSRPHLVGLANDVEGSEKADFQRFFLQQGAEWSAASAEMLACNTLGCSRSSWLKQLRCFGRIENRYRKLRVVCSSSESKLSQGEKKPEGHWTEEKKNRSRQWGGQRCGHAGCFV